MLKCERGASSFRVRTRLSHAWFASFLESASPGDSSPLSGYRFPGPCRRRHPAHDAPSRLGADLAPMRSPGRLSCSQQALPQPSSTPPGVPPHAPRETPGQGDARRETCPFPEKVLDSGAEGEDYTFLRQALPRGRGRHLENRILRIQIGIQASMTKPVGSGPDAKSGQTEEVPPSQGGHHQRSYISWPPPPGEALSTESLILAQDERWRRA